MISGGPGTGKTVVALHRAAYLLYSNRRRFESGGVLVVGPSRVFMNYIERVLPSLGEESVTLRSIGSVASDVVRITGDRVDPAAAAAIKGSLRMAQVLRRTGARAARRPVPLELRLTFKGHVLGAAAGDARQIRDDVLAHHKLNAGREAAEKALLNALWRIRPDGSATRTGTSSTTGSPTSPAFADVLQRVVAGHQRDRGAAPAGRPGDCMRRVSGRCFQRRDASWSVRAIAPGDRQLDRRPTGRCWTSWSTCSGPCPAEEARRRRCSSSLTPSCPRWSPRPTGWPRTREVDPFEPPHETYAHVLVDEAQDITPMQWRMLRRRGRRRQLDDRRRPRAELLARRRRGRARDAARSSAPRRYAGSG